jgi:cysteine-rich repeat protein
MAKLAERRAIAAIGCAILGAFAASSGACGGIGADDDFFNSGAGGQGRTTSGGGMPSTTTSAVTTGSTTTSATTSTTTSGTTTSSATTSSTTSSSTTTTTTSSTSTGVMCGNGIKEMGEQCDGQDLGTFNCTTVGYSNWMGAVCSPQCKVNYGGCMPTCDGQKLEPMEVCDGPFLNGKTCKDYGFSHGDGLKCNVACGFDTTGCKPTCDGQLLEPGEVCDGNFLNGKTCADFGYVAAAGLKCTGCKYDKSNCKATCGNNTVEPGETCDDGNMQSGDGCSPACQIEGGTCATAIKVPVAPGNTIEVGTTVNAGFHTAAGCKTDGNDRIYAITPTTDGFITASLPRQNTTYNSALWVSTSCSDAAPNTPIVCEDSYDPMTGQPLNGGEVLSFHAQANVTYYLFIDGPGNADAGGYTVNLNLATGKDCNDPVPIPLEAGTPMTLLGTNAGAVNDTGGSCGGGAGEDVVYAITRTSNGPIAVLASAALSNFNTSLYARSMCADGNTELVCSNNPAISGEMVSIAPMAAGVPVFLYMDGSTLGGGSPSGNYGLVVTP